MAMYYHVLNVGNYVKDLIADGAKPIRAEKFARILAREANPGEEVISWSVAADGSPILEKTATANLGDWVVQKADSFGDPIIDSNGNPNEWIISGEVFRRKYVEADLPGLYKPVGGIQQFLKLPEGICLQQWGEEMTVDVGGYINITNPDDMYVISGRDFADTYKEVK